MTHYHDPSLVVLSIAVAILASYTALHVGDRIKTSTGNLRYGWLAAAALALGGGIWSMHFVAMLAFHLPHTQVSYDVTITLISFALPVAVTAYGFAVVATSGSALRLAFSGAIMGLGIVAMHYTGMAAIEFGGSLHYAVKWVAISVVIAIAAATAALWLARLNTGPSQRWIAAVVMGLAISGMHYSAMAGATFEAHQLPSNIPARSSVGQTTLALWVSLATILILALGLVASIFDHRFSEHNQRQQRALRESEQRFLILVQGVTDYAIFMLDGHGHISNWNAGAERIKGYSSAEVIGRHFSMFHTAEDREAGVPQRALATAEQSGRFQAEGWRVRKDGGKFWAHVVIQPLRDDRGTLVGFAKITRDITEAKEARERLEQTRALLAQSQKMEAIGQLTGGVAHDFNNLLMIVLGNLDLAYSLLDRSDLDRERLRRAIQNARHGAERGSNLTRSLLAFSRRQPLEPRIIDVNQALKDVTGLLRRALGEDRPLETVGAAGLWNIEVDIAQLEAALLIDTKPRAGITPC